MTFKNQQGVAAILLVTAQSESTRDIRDVYKTEVSSILIRPSNGGPETLLLVPKHVARFITSVLDSSPARQVHSATHQKPWWDLLRRWNIRPRVEIGPGAFKHDIINRPPDTLGKEMKKLLALQTRQENQAKDLNAGNENNV